MCQGIQLWLNLSETFNWVPKSWGWGMGVGTVQVGAGRLNRHCQYMKPNVLGNEAKILLVQRGDARLDTPKSRRHLSPAK